MSEQMIVLIVELCIGILRLIEAASTERLRWTHMNEREPLRWLALWNCMAVLVLAIGTAAADGGANATRCYFAITATCSEDASLPWTMVASVTVT